MFHKFIGSDNYTNYVSYLSDLYQSVFLKLREPGTDLIKYFVSEGDIVFDIGANIGRFTTLAAGLVGKKGNVYCFEPLSYALRILRHMVFIKRLHQVVIYDLAISNENGRSIMTIPLKDSWKPKTSLAYLGKTRDNEDKVKREEVKLITLDDFCASSNVRQLNFIKCDVEGYEYNVFSAGISTLIRFKPAIFCEINESFCKHNNIRVSDIFSLLEDIGYRSFLPYMNEFLFPVTGFDSNEKKAEFFFIHTSKQYTYSNIIKE